MESNVKYKFNSYYCFNKKEFKGRLEKQLGDFGEQLIMTILGRMKKYSVAYVDHEGADLLATERLQEGNNTNNVRRYAVSVKSHQIGNDESQVVSFKYDDQIKLSKFAYDFKAIPLVAEVIVSKDFSFIDVFMLTLKNFTKLAEVGEKKKLELINSGKQKDGIDYKHEYPELAIGKDKNNGLTINNYVFNIKKQCYEDNKYTEYLYNNEFIQHIRVDICDRPDGKSFGGCAEDCNIDLLQLANKKDGNLTRQLGTFGEHLMVFMLGHLKNYRVARVDHIGADLIAVKRDSDEKPLAISVKTRYSDIGYTYKYEEIEKLVNFADDYGCTPAVAYILPEKSKSARIFDIYLMTLDNLIQYSKDTDFDTHTLMSDMEANTYEYLRLGKEKLLELELKFNNTEKLRNYVNEHPEIDHSTMEFPLCP